MGYWGKFIGGFAGFMAGGPFGAVVGAALGHAADEGALSLAQRGGLGSILSAGGADIAALLGSRETLFAISVVVLSAKLSKVDGPVRREEIDAFKRHFRIPPENQVEVGRLFDQARSSAEGYESFAERLAQAFADNRGMLEDVLGALFAIARADGPLNRAELGFLAGVHNRFGLGPDAWERLREGTGSGYSRRAAPEQGGDPYAVLGVPRSAPDDAVRQAWRNLMRENHPDSLAARGVPPEFVERATAKVAEINAAWDRVKRERGL